ncbi:hypothetical protein F0562_012658 [Nyssa sinensis]|uniref:Uncharacterized protein n=1 Tax=Nyssa sinensis TaxID=561372 RepID=A0A5J4ZWH4_9ASTE|nr:hypothetical protein F0562_012658 [Nyssa sinensis]
MFTTALNPAVPIDEKLSGRADEYRLKLFISFEYKARVLNSPLRGHQSHVGAPPPMSVVVGIDGMIIEQLNNSGLSGFLLIGAWRN